MPSDADVRILLNEAQNAVKYHWMTPFDHEAIVHVCEDWLKMRERLNAILSRSRWATWNSTDERLEPRFSDGEFIELCKLAGIEPSKCNLTQDQEE